MNTSNFDIDDIVKRILVDLTAKAETVIKPIALPEPIVVDEKELVVESRVLSLSELNGRIDSIRKITVSPKTVITPSVKDMLRKRNIEIATKLPGNFSVAKKNSTLWLGVHSSISVSLRLSEQLKKNYGLTAATFDTLLELIDEAERQVETARGIALSNKSATALRLANRREKIRAVLGYDPKQTQADTAELAANLLVVDPGRVGDFRVMEIIKNYFC